MQWLAMIMCLYAGVVSEPTEENQQQTLSNVTADSSFPPKSCFRRPPIDCLDLDADSNQGGCKRITLGNTFKGDGAFCCNTNDLTLDSDLSRIGFPSNISYLHIRNATLDNFYANEVRWKMLEHLSVTDGKIEKVEGEFLMKAPTTCVNLSNNALTKVPVNLLKQLAKLNNLDLSHNNIAELPSINAMQGHNLTLDISGMNKIWCNDVYKYINKTGDKKYENENVTVCSTNKTWHWFNATEQVSITQIRYLSKLQEDCPKGDTWQCQCKFRRLDIVEGKPPTLAVNVDCSGIQLTELPEKLPTYTISLNVSHNNITTLSYFNTNTNKDDPYNDILEFYADYNQISSIYELEGSTFVENYLVLSLRYNKIKSLPTYILSQTSHNNILRMIRLGGNELQCDCNSAKHLKAWLQIRVSDADQVMCDNVKEKVIDLEPSNMCVYPGDWTDYIYYIIAFEVILLISLITKVSYDYWVFKTAGYLPWPANKMPKLPCDCLCET